MSGFDPKKHGGFPPSVMLGETIRLRAQQLSELAAQELQDLGLVVANEASSFITFNEDSPRFPFLFEEIDAVRIRMLNAGDEIASVGLELFCDQSPLILDEDVAREPWGAYIDYDLITMGAEIPPYITHSDWATYEPQRNHEYLEGVRDGKFTPPRLLDEEACLQMLGILLNPELDRLIDLDEIPTIAQE